MMSMASLTVIMAVLFLTWKSVSSSNPLKTALNLTFLTAVMSIWFMITTGSTWFQLMFMLVFLGGIIMMFMILSSVSPNSPSSSTKLMSKTMMVTPLLIMLSQSTIGNTRDLSTGKLFLTASHNNIFMILIMLAYFIMFNQLMAKKETSMRSHMCYNKVSLVN